MPQILDARGHPSPASVKAAGYVGIAQYLSTAGNPKDLTPALARAYSDEGLLLVTPWETTANRALQGEAAGHVDGASAANLLDACGAPEDAVAFGAVDFAAAVAAHARLAGADQTDPALASATMTLIGQYFHGFGVGLGTHLAGGYGDQAVIDYLFSLGLIVKGWQTVAWSGGKRSAHACLFQRAQQVTVGGVTCDINDVLMADFGGWRIGGPTPPPPDPMPSAYPLDLEVVLSDIAKSPTDALRAAGRRLWRFYTGTNIPDEKTLDIIVYAGVTNGAEAMETACSDSPQGQAFAAKLQGIA